MDASRRMFVTVAEGALLFMVAGESDQE
jgi:hypothetical protein